MRGAHGSSQSRSCFEIRSEESRHVRGRVGSHRLMRVDAVPGPKEEGRKGRGTADGGAFSLGIPENGEADGGQRGVRLESEQHY